MSTNNAPAHGPENVMPLQIWCLSPLQGSAFSLSFSQTFLCIDPNSQPDFSNRTSTRVSHLPWVWCMASMRYVLSEICPKDPPCLKALGDKVRRLLWDNTPCKLCSYTLSLLCKYTKWGGERCGEKQRWNWVVCVCIEKLLFKKNIYFFLFYGHDCPACMNACAFSKALSHFSNPVRKSLINHKEKPKWRGQDTQMSKGSASLGQRKAGAF